MRYAILSDIHANLPALTAVLDRLASARIDRYLCLGDLVGYGAEPAACLARLESCHAVMVAGNHEAACIGKLELGWFNHAARTAIQWTRNQLSLTDLDSLRCLPLTTTVEPCTLVHGSLRHPERFEYLVDVAQIVDTLVACETLLCLVGHTHVPCLVEYQRASRRVTRVLTEPQELAEVSFVNDAETWRYLVNPGSVGQPRDGDPRAGYAIVDTDQARIWMHRTSYDVVAAQQKIRQAGLPALLADRLAVGR